MKNLMDEKRITIHEARLSNSTVLQIKLDNNFIITETRRNIKTINVLNIDSIEMYMLGGFYYIRTTTSNGIEYDIGTDESWDQKQKCLEAYNFIKDHWMRIIDQDLYDKKIIKDK